MWYGLTGIGQVTFDTKVWWQGKKDFFCNFLYWLFSGIECNCKANIKSIFFVVLNNFKCRVVSTNSDVIIFCFYYLTEGCISYLQFLNWFVKIFEVFYLFIYLHAQRFLHNYFTLGNHSHRITGFLKREGKNKVLFFLCRKPINTYENIIMSPVICYCISSMSAFYI